MSAFRNLSVNAKLAVLSIVATGSALAIACVVFVAYDYVTFRDGMARKLTAEATIVGANSASALVFRDPEAARTTLEALRAERYVTAAGVYNSDGSLFAALASTQRPADVALKAPVAYGHVFVGSELRVLQPIAVGGEVVGTAAIWTGLDELYERFVSYVAIALVVLVVAFIVAYAISILPKRIILEPILQLAATARRVSENKDYSVRDQVSVRAEVGTMVDAFNEMLGQIEKNDTELQHARDDAVEASRLKSAFLANMSHEIRTPLNIILGYNDLIGEMLTESGNDQASNLFEPVRRASHRLLQTINGILDISKIETHQFGLDQRPLALAPVIARQEQEFRVLAEPRRVSLRTEIQEPAAAVVFDEYCLTQALGNLINNALKFTEHGEVVVRLYRDGNGQLAIDVRDTGVGIDPHYLPQLFQAFSQEDSSYTRQFEGTGLGLALTKRYLELNAATIAVRSEKGKGSVFTIAFSSSSEVPITAVAVSQNEDLRPPQAQPEPPPRPQRPLVLVVEDDADTRLVMRAILDDRYAVAEASSGEEVRRMLSEHGHTIQAILMDLSLKGDEDGLEITSHLRRLNGWREVPIIATTAHAFAEDRDRALAAGCDNFLAKPIQPHLLLEALRVAIGV